ncbi:hypothetical protein DPMN_042072 [Dreissena polymorpha]|uniref:Uncharacterized protein n=1 Tax=Dreissena polymorpha TaxID=45954 RepID=A0A9D4CZV6_DREPO|nr:hypothetical protein DPMN_042072 [Dreissena polymorpha]
MKGNVELLVIFLAALANVSAWATFEICETVNTIARGASVIITSPGYLGTSNATGSGPQMCECILQSHDRADVYMDYLQTELASLGDTCPYEFVLLESKRNLTQSSIDKVMEVCGKKQTDGRWFEGAIRLTYASGGPMQKRGMLAKFTVDNIGNQPMMELECGKVDSASLQLQTRPVTAPATGGAGFGFFGMPFPMMPPMVPSLPVMPNMPLGFPGLSMSQPTLPTHVAPATGIQLLGRSPPVHTDFSNWNFRVAGEKTPSLTDLQTAKVQIPSNIFNQPTAEKPSAPAPNKQAVASKLIPAQAVNNNQRAGMNVRQWSNGEESPSIHNGKGRVVNDKDVATSEAPKPESGNDSGGMVALIFAVVGSVMILGSVGILAVNNYRKRQRIKRKEAEYAYGGSGSYTYGKGWETTSVGENNPAFQDDEEVYATVAEVEVYRSGGCDGGINPSIGIPAPAFPAKSRSNTDASSQGRPNPRILDDDYDSLSLSTTSLSSTEDEKPATEFGRQTQVSVVDFHRNFNDGITPDVSSTSLTKSSLTNPKCTSACLYASANKLSATGCTECSLTRPPRRSDASRGYDNNAGVNSKKRY